MITSGDFAELLSHCLDVSRATVDLRGKQLRAQGRLSTNGRGPRSAAHMTDADAVTWLLASVIDHGRGGDVVQSVDRVRALPGDCLILPDGFADGVSFAAATRAGTALEMLLQDIRSSRLDRWSQGNPYNLKVTLEESGERVAIALDRNKPADINAAISLFTRKKSSKLPLVEWQITIHEAALLQIGNALGPLDPAALSA